jgi:site-specific DNA-methyltransferase (adenine-specific)
MQRKPGGYRQPTGNQRELSKIPKENFREWCQQTWTLTGASTRDHPAPFPLELASRLVKMFSFVGDTVLDPFAGTGTTLLAAAKANRNSIGVEIDPEYCRIGQTRLESKLQSLFNEAKLSFEIPTEVESVIEAV